MSFYLTIFNFLTISNYSFSATKECVGCMAGFYCPGNNQEIRCGYDDETRYMYSFGSASKCSTCPQGWVCIYMAGKVHYCR